MLVELLRQEQGQVEPLPEVAGHDLFDFGIVSFAAVVMLAVAEAFSFSIRCLQPAVEDDVSEC